MNKIFLFCFLIPFALFSQGEFNHWHFGSGATLNFNSGSPVQGGSSAINVSEGSATVSDCEGNLLFYTDGATVWNSSNSIMTNGTGLDGASTSVLGSPSTQGSLIVKRPETSGIYYIFTASESKGLKYSIVNMNLNGGAGEVIIKNTLLSTSRTQKLAVTYHSNSKDIWLVTHYAGSNEYEAFLVTRTGVSLSGVSSLDGATHDDGHGDLKISRDGSKIAAVIDFEGEVYLGDFNNSTGVVTNTAMASGFLNPHGVDFSPNGSKMYVNSTTGGVLQFQVGASNPQTLSNPVALFSGTGIYGSLQLGPDDRIYVTDANSSYLSVISNPDASGFAAGFSYESLFIGSGRAGYEVTNVTLVSPNSFNGPNTVQFNNTCSNDITQFSLANETDVVDVLWEFGDPNSILKNYSTKISPEHEYTSTGTFNGNVEINYACGSEVINFTVVISEAPSITYNFDTACSGVPIELALNQIANTSYSWSPNTDLSNPNISNPIFNKITSEEVTYIQYSVTASNNTSGCSSNRDVFVQVVNPIVDAGPDQEFCSEATVQIGSIDLVNYTYSWTPATGIVSPDNSLTSLIVSNSSDTTQTKQITLEASYSGCASTDDVDLQIRALPKLSSPKDTSICSLDSIILNTNGDQGSTYSWSDAEGLSSINEISPKFSISNKDTGTVEYLKEVMMTKGGCVDFDTVSIKVYPQAGVDNYQYLCPGFGVTLHPFGKGASFVWSPNQDIDNVSAENPIVDPSSTTTYFVDITDVYGCNYRDSVLVDVNPVVPLDLGPDTVICRDDTILIGSLGHPLNAVFSWNPNTFLSDPDSNYTYAYPDSTLSYVVTSQSDTCFGYDTIQINVNQLPNVVLNSDSSICFRDSIYLVATGALNYSWSPNTFLVANGDSAFVYPQDTINYIVSGVDTNGCVNQDTATISVRPLPVIGLTPSASVCLTDSIQVDASGGGSYSWSPAEFVSNETAANPFLIPDKDTRFIVTVLGTNDCYENDTIDVVVHDLPVISMTSDTIICDGTDAYLWASGGVKYQWSPSLSLNADNISNPVSSTTVPETFQVIVTDQNDCVDSLSTTVGINVSPEADFDYGFVASCPGFDVDFTDKSTSVDSWSWGFGDGGTSTSKSPSHVYEFGRPATATLIVGNNNYCFDTASVNFNWQNLEDYITIFAPNVITPNGNKINDCFEVEIEGDFESCTQIEVFNRWGMKVYDNTEFDGCFRGVNEYNLQDLSVGTYFYVITINDFVKNGFVQIIR